jgi:pumilio RNA-binding family
MQVRTIYHIHRCLCSFALPTFADYVLQRALAVVEGDQRDILIGKIKPQLVTMRRYANAYTKHLNSSRLST